MRHLVSLCLGIACLSSSVLGATAHMTVRYDGATPIPVHVQTGSLVQINFPAGLTGYGGAVSEADVALSEDAAHPHRLQIKAVHPPAEALIHVNTVTGAQYLLQIKTVTKKPHDIINVVDAPDPLAVPPSQASAARDTPSPIADPVRLIWVAQWSGDPRLAPRGVTMTPLRETLLSTSEQRIEILWSYTTRGFYGFTEKIINTSPTPMVLWLPGLHDPYARLWSANLDHHTPPLAPSAQPHMLEPGQSVLLHLVYEEVKD